MMLQWNFSLSISLPFKLWFYLYLRQGKPKPSPLWAADAENADRRSSDAFLGLEINTTEALVQFWRNRKFQREQGGELFKMKN